MNGFELPHPGVVPPLDFDFRPAVLANHAYQKSAESTGVPLVIGLERESGKISRYETKIFPDTHPLASTNLPYVERLIKFLLWQRGGFRIYAGGPPSIGVSLRQAYSAAGKRAFDTQFMGSQVYETPFEVITCLPEEVPSLSEKGTDLKGGLEGCRIGFDLGASDRKVSAVVDGKVIFSEEVIWEPRKNSNPEYHYEEIMTALRSAMAKMDRLDAIGGSSAGIMINNRPMVASLFRGVPAEDFAKVNNLFIRIQAELGVPMVVINDGDVAALAGAMSLEENGVLGIALGSSEAAGYINPEGQIVGWLNELAFAPIDYNPHAPVDEWSGDLGTGASYLSQQCVFRLCEKAGIELPAHITDAEKLAFVQEYLKKGHPGASRIWQTMGIYLGYALAHYADFYDIRHVLLLGRCTSGIGGTLLLDGVQCVFRDEFPEYLDLFKVQLPDEKSRRVGQSIAAASLPQFVR